MLLSFPIFLPIIREMPDVSLLWFVVLVAVVLQTSFLTPPFGYALFYLLAISRPIPASTQGSFFNSPRESRLAATGPAPAHSFDEITPVLNPPILSSPKSR